MSTCRRFMAQCAVVLGLAQTSVIVRALTPLRKKFAFLELVGPVSAAPIGPIVNSEALVSIAYQTIRHDIEVEYWPGQDPEQMASAELLRDVGPRGVCLRLVDGEDTA